MTKKDYINHAGIFNDIYSIWGYEESDNPINEMLDTVCEWYKNDNHLFDEEKFREACLDGII